jgi:predicted DNA binding protein
MSVSTKLYIEHERLALAPTVRQLDGIDIQVVTQSTTNPGGTVFPFLVEYGDQADLEVAFDADPTVESYELVDWTGRSGIYYIEHTSETLLISTVVTDANGFLVHAETKSNGWIVRLVLPDRAALNAVWEYARENDISLDIIELYRNDDADGTGSYGLTDQQLAALKLAYEKGYFDEPRDISLSEVADELGLSSTAMSGRLRRGMRNLIAATLADEDVET